MTEWIYSLTKNFGKTLYESIPDHVFNDYIAKAYENYLEESKVGGDCREEFVGWYISRLNPFDWEELAEKHSIRGTGENRIKSAMEYFVVHEFPGESIDDRERFAQKEIEFITWDDINKEDDIEVALHFGLVKYPPFDRDKKTYINGGRNTIPAKVANKIYQVGGTMQAVDLERKAVGEFITVDGFYCDIHGGKAYYKKPIKKSEAPLCPACGHPICPVCANCFSKTPSTVEESREYMQSCDSSSGHAYCGNCGDYSPQFMLSFLKLVGAPIPPEYKNFKEVPRENVTFLATATVNALPDFPEIFAKVKEKWDKGVTGIIKVQHPTGEIWGWTDRYPDRWVVTILYPEER